MNISSSLATSVYLLAATLSPLSLPAQEALSTIGHTTSKEELPSLQLHAKLGNDNAQYRLAGLYALGLHVPSDFKQGIAWLEKAAQQGHIYAQYYLGAYYSADDEFLVKKDVKKANECFAKAFPRLQKLADRGEVLAQYVLSGMYYQGQWVKQDKQKALQLLLKALPDLQALADKGNLEAQIALASLMTSKVAIPDVEAISLRYFKKLADQGASTAQSQLAVYALSKSQLEESIALARQAASNNCPMAAMILVTIHYHSPIKASDEELLGWLKLMEDQYMNIKDLLSEEVYAMLQALKQASPTSESSE